MRDLVDEFPDLTPEISPAESLEIEKAEELKNYCELLRKSGDRIYFTPSPELDEAIGIFQRKAKEATMLRISRTQALSFFAERGLKAWMTRGAENEKECPER